MSFWLVTRFILNVSTSSDESSLVFLGKPPLENSGLLAQQLLPIISLLSNEINNNYI